MKKLICILFIIGVSGYGYAQNFGLRFNSSLSPAKRINQIYGGGVFVNLNDYSDNVELLLSADLTRGKKKLNSDSLNSDYQNFQIALSALRPVSLSKDLDLKIGPKLSYINTFTIDQKNGSSLINYYQSRYFAAGLVLDLQYQGVFGLPLNIDLFISPDYLINAKNNFSPPGFVSDYSTKNLSIFNFQFGLSYSLKK